ncbi:MAG: CHASE domain-containing protein, partial [Pseudomonadota bacterium]
MKFPKILILSLLTGFLLSTLLAKLQATHNLAILQEAATELASQFESQIQSKLERYQYGLRGARGAILTVGIDKMRRETFLRYIESRDQRLEFPGARGFGFIRRVSPDGMEDFLQITRADGVPDFQVRQLQEHSGANYVIQY